MRSPWPPPAFARQRGGVRTGVVVDGSRRFVADTPEARAARDDDVMAAVAQLHPTDALEAKLAANIVTVEVYAMDTFRLAGEFRSDIAVTLRCRAHATVLLRQMRGLLRDYQRGQAARDKALTEMHPAAMERAGYWFLSGASNFNWLDDHNVTGAKPRAVLLRRSVRGGGQCLANRERLADPEC